MVFDNEKLEKLDFFEEQINDCNNHLIDYWLLSDNGW